MSDFNDRRMDNPIMMILQRFGDIILISILFALCSLPIITFGAACTAAYRDMYDVIHDRQQFTIYGYFQCFKENFKKATLLWLILLAVGIVIGGDIYFAWQAGNGTLIGSLFYFFIGAAILYLFVCLYIFPLQASFENSLINSFKNALVLSLRNVLYTILLFILWFLPIILIILIQNFIYYIASYMFLFGFGISFYVSVRIFDKIFLKFRSTCETV